MKKSKNLIVILTFSIGVFACKTMPSSIDEEVKIDEKVKIDKDVERQVVDNTFQATIVNNSPFTVSIDEKTIKKGASIKNSFPLMESKIYDGWFVNYTIPLSKDVYYLHKEKVQITNNQTTVMVESPTDSSMREVYIVVKNTSKQSIQLTDGLYGLLSCCLNGRINSYNVQHEYNIAPSKVAVHEISKENEIENGRVFVFQNDKHHSLLENTTLQRGYVYTYEFNGKEVIKVDERPILKVGEPLWKAEDVTICIEKVLRGANLFYIVGKKRVFDADDNAYYCPYISCIDGANNLQWKTEESSLDGYIKDAILLEDGSILACGQSLINEENTGSIWLYSSDGTLLSSKNYDSLQELINLAVVDGGIVIAGFDDEGKLSLSKIAISKSSISQAKKMVASLPHDIIESTATVFLLYEDTSKTLLLFCNLANEEGQILPTKLFTIKENGKTDEVALGEKIASVSCAVQSETGVIYAGGESTIDEKTEAVVLKIEAEKDATLRTSSVFYQGSVPFSYLASMTLDETNKTLTVGGVCRAKESSGVGGLPFIASFDMASGKRLIYREYKDAKKQLLRSFVPALDYGFIASFSTVVQDGEFAYYGDSLLARMTLTGEIKEGK